MERWLVLMHSDTTRDEDSDAWGPFLDRLVERGELLGGSSLGPATGLRSPGPAAPATPVVGYLLVQAETLEDVRTMMTANPVLVAGGTLEIRSLVPD